MKTRFISASPLSPRCGGSQNISLAGVLITPFSATVISCLPPKHHFFGTTLTMTSLTFHAGKCHVWEIGLLEDLLFYNSESGAQPAEQLLRTAKGRQEEGSLRGPTPPPTRRLLQLFGRHWQHGPGWVRAAAGESSRMSPGR